MSDITLLLEGSLNQGIGIAIDSFNETNMEITIENITKRLNELKWSGKNDWTTDYITRYIDNMRGNLNSAIVGNMMRRKIFNIQSQNIAIINFDKIKSSLQGFLGTVIKATALPISPISSGKTKCCIVSTSTGTL